jgi:hypothetical protein
MTGSESHIGNHIDYFKKLKTKCYKNSWCSWKRLARNPLLLNEKPTIPLQIFDIPFFFTNVGVRGWNSFFVKRKATSYGNPTSYELEFLCFYMYRAIHIKLEIVNV